MTKFSCEENATWQRERENERQRNGRGTRRNTTRFRRITWGEIRRNRLGFQSNLYGSKKGLQLTSHSRRKKFSRKFCRNPGSVSILSENFRCFTGILIEDSLSFAPRVSPDFTVSSSFGQHLTKRKEATGSKAIKKEFTSIARTVNGTVNGTKLVKEKMTHLIRNKTTKIAQK